VAVDVTRNISFVAKYFISFTVWKISFALKNVFNLNIK